MKTLTPLKQNNLYTIQYENPKLLDYEFSETNYRDYILKTSPHGCDIK